MEITKKWLLALFLGLLVLSPAVWADTPIGGVGTYWELPSFGNAQVLNDLLLAIGRIAHDDTYRTILLTVGTLGVLMMAAQFTFDAGKALVKSISYFITLVGMLFVFGVGASGGNSRLTVNVVIVDVVSGDRIVVTEPLPGFIVWPQVFIYNIGHKLTGILETQMGGPTYAGLSTGSPFNLAGQMLRDASKIKITDSKLKASITDYIANCASPMIANGNLDPNELATSSDVFMSLKVNNAVLSSTVYNADGTVSILGCPDAHAAIKARLDTLFNAAGVDDALKSAMGMSGTQLSFAFGDMAKNALIYSTGDNGADPKNLVLQNAMADLIDQGMTLGPASYSSDQIMAQTQIELAHQSQLSAWDSGLAIFSKTMGYFFCVLQAFLFAAFPVLIVGFLVPGLGKPLLANTIQVIIWMALWEPMLAIISFITAGFIAQETQGVMNASGNPAHTLANLGLITQRAQTLVSAAGFMATTMPMLTWGLVKGSFAFTEFISHGVGTQFANTAGTGTATGNLAMGVRSLDTATANKHSTAFSSDGQMGSTQFSMSLGGLGAHGMATPKSTEGYAMKQQRQDTADSRRERGLAETFSQTANASRTEAANYQQQQAKVLEDAMTKAYVASHKTTADKLTSTERTALRDESISLAKRADEAAMAAGGWGTVKGDKAAEEVYASASAKGGFNAGPIAIGGEAGVRGSRTWSQDETESQERKDSRTNSTARGYDAKLANGHNSKSGRTGNVSDSGGTDFSSAGKIANSKTFTQLKSLGLQYQQAVQQARTATENATLAQSRADSKMVTRDVAITAADAGDYLSQPSGGDLDNRINNLKTQVTQGINNTKNEVGTVPTAREIEAKTPGSNGAPKPLTSEGQAVLNRAKAGNAEVVKQESYENAVAFLNTNKGEEIIKNRIDQPPEAVPSPAPGGAPERFATRDEGEAKRVGGGAPEVALRYTNRP